MELKQNDMVILASTIKTLEEHQKSKAYAAHKKKCNKFDAGFKEAIGVMACIGLSLAIDSMKDLATELERAIKEKKEKSESDKK